MGIFQTAKPNVEVYVMIVIHTMAVC